MCTCPSPEIRPVWSTIKICRVKMNSKAARINGGALPPTNAASYLQRKGARVEIRNTNHRNGSRSSQAYVDMNVSKTVRTKNMCRRNETMRLRGSSMPVKNVGECGGALPLGKFADFWESEKIPKHRSEKRTGSGEIEEKLYRRSAGRWLWDDGYKRAGRHNMGYRHLLGTFFDFVESLFGLLPHLT